MYDARWETPREIIEEVHNHDSIPGQVIWTMGNCRVSVTDFNDGNYELQWSKNDDTVVLIKYADGVLVQLWRFGKSAAIAVKLSDTSVFERWEMEKSTMTCKRTESKKWLFWERSKDVESLKKYRQCIASWCEQNHYWVKMPCRIFNGVESDVIWMFCSLHFIV